MGRPSEGDDGLFAQRWRFDDERGAALVEMAVVAPILIMLLLGLITFGNTHHQNISLESAARETSRFGATYPIADAGSLDDWLRAVGVAAENAAGGNLSVTVDSRLVCVAHGASANPSGFTRLVAVGSQTVASAPTGVGWCFENEAPNSDTVVQVHLQRQGTIQAFFFSMTPTLSAEATTRFERNG